MSQAHTTSWIHSLIPTSASWAVIATELAALFFIAALVFAWFALRGRRQRIKAARALLDERDRMADAATQTVAMHLKALLSGKEPSDDDLEDYRERSRDLIGRFCQPWLEPSKTSLRDGVQSVLALRHTDLHQMAALFGSDQPQASDGADDAAVTELRKDLEESKKSEALRSKQLQEALTTIGTMVAEYGRKFEASVDHRAGQILRALIYLQALDEGNDEKRAKEIVDEVLNEDLEVLNQSNENGKTSTPSAETVAAAAAAEAASLSTELDAEEQTGAPAQPSADESRSPVDSADDFADEILAEVGAEATPEPQAEVEQAPAPIEAPNEPDSFEDLDDIDALISQAQSDIESKGKPAPEPAAAAEPSAAEPGTAAQEGTADKEQSDSAEATTPVADESTAKEPSAPEAETTAEPAPDASDAKQSTDSEPPPENEEPDISDIVDLDEVELPQKTEPQIDAEDEAEHADSQSAGGDSFDLDLDDIDALLDAEIARHQSGKGGSENEDELDLSK